MGQDVLQPASSGSVTIAGTVNIRALTAADVVSAIQSGAWAVSLNAGGSIDITDRAGRLLGEVSVTGAVEVATDPDSPLDVADTDATRRWQDSVTELLDRQTDALERLAIALT